MNGIPLAHNFPVGPGVTEALAEVAAIASEVPPTDVPSWRVFARGLNRLGGTPPDLLEIRNTTIPRRLGGIGLRVYRPAAGRLPVVLFLHGGSFFHGDLETHDTLCRSLASAAGCVVIAMHYRRGPEHPCPAAPDDCIETARWIVEHADDLGVDPRTFAIVGDDAGGALAAVTSRRARDTGGPTLCAQVLLYPVISRDQASASWGEMAEAPVVSAELMRSGWSMYVPPGNEAKPEDVAPGSDDCTGLPPTLVLTAEYDPLRDEAEAYADALRAAGVSSTARRYPGMIHGFIGMAGVIPAGREAIEEVAAFLTAAFDAVTAG